MIHMPENRNAKGEDIGRFTAEMMALAKRPEMRGFLTSTEVARQAKEKEAEAQAEKERKEAEAIELKRRDDITAEWFSAKMMTLEPHTWMLFQASKNKRELKGWRLTAKAMMAAPEGFTPVPVTLCSIFHKGKLQIRERLVWMEPKPIKGKIIV